MKNRNKKNSKVIRLFVSSTFSDYTEERNALQESVFPKMRELCRSRGYRFQAIDLRWGVSEEAGINQQTMKICLDELTKCQTFSPLPNFLILFGDRYGWLPLPYVIITKEFEDIIGIIKQSIKEGKLEQFDLDILLRWYRLDNNTVPGHYLLLPRKEVIICDLEPDEVINFSKRTEDIISWEITEMHLRRILQYAVSNIELSNIEREKYSLSATGQEIVNGALRIENASEHVLCFFREIQNFNFGLVKNIKIEKSLQKYVNTDHNGYIDEEAFNKLNLLKAEIKSKISENNWRTYKVNCFDGRIPEDYITTFCQDVESMLSDIINKRIDSEVSISTLHKEIIYQQNELENHLQYYIPRDSINESLFNYLSGPGGKPYIVFGPEGIGKTSFMAGVVHLVSEQYPDADIVFRFIGSSPQCSTPKLLFKSLSAQIYESFKEIPIDESCFEAEDEFTVFQKLIQEFPKDRKIIIFLDNIDGMNHIKAMRDFNWLSLLPDNIKVVVSITTPGETYDSFIRKFSLQNFLEIPAFSEKEAITLIENFLGRQNKTLKNEIKSRIFNEYIKNKIPFYLMLSISEAATYRSFDHVFNVNDNISDIFQSILLKLKANHGDAIVMKSLGYIALSSSGLAEDELLDLLSEDDEVMEEFHNRNPKSPSINTLPIVIWSRLTDELSNLIIEVDTEGIMLFRIANAKFKNFLNYEYITEGTKEYILEMISGYFEKQQLFNHASSLYDPELSGLLELRILNNCGRDSYPELVNLRKLIELPNSLKKLKAFKRLNHLLSDPIFSETLCGYDEQLFYDCWELLKSSSEYRPTDSYINIINEPKDYSSRLRNILINLFVYYNEIELASLLQKSITEQAMDSKNTKDIAIGFLNQGSILGKNGDISAAIENYIKGAELCRINSFNDILPLILANWAIALEDLNEYDEAIKKYKEAEFLLRELGDIKQLALNLKNQAIYYYNIGNKTKHFTLLKESKELEEKAGGTGREFGAPPNKPNTGILSKQQLNILEMEDEIKILFNDRKYREVFDMFNIYIAQAKGLGNNDKMFYYNKQTTILEDYTRILIEEGNKQDAILFLEILGTIYEDLATLKVEESFFGGERVVQSDLYNKSLVIAIFTSGILEFDLKNIEKGKQKIIRAIELARNFNMPDVTSEIIEYLKSAKITDIE